MLHAGVPWLGFILSNHAPLTLFLPPRACSPQTVHDFYHKSQDQGVVFDKESEAYKSSISSFGATMKKWCEAQQAVENHKPLKNPSMVIGTIQRSGWLNVQFDAPASESGG